MRNIVVLLSFLFCAYSQATEPIKIRIWNGYPVGGASDQQMRLLKGLIEIHDPTAIVHLEYRPGAAGIIAYDAFVRNQPGEYVELMIDAINHLITMHVVGTRREVPVSQFDILYPLGNVQCIVLAGNHLDARTLRDLLVSKRKQFNYGSPGVGSISQFLTEHVGSAISKPLTHVPYRNLNSALPELLRGDLDLFTDLVVSSNSIVRAGMVRALAVTGSRRSTMLPDVPTFAEQGMGIPFDPWYAIFYNPRNDPQRQAQVKMLLRRVLEDPRTYQRYLDIGTVVNVSSIRDPQAWFAKEVSNMKRIARDTRFSSLQQRSKDSQ